MNYFLREQARFCVILLKCTTVLILFRCIVFREETTLACEAAPTRNHIPSARGRENTMQCRGTTTSPVSNTAHETFLSLYFWDNTTHTFLKPGRHVDYLLPIDGLQGLLWCSLQCPQFLKSKLNQIPVLQASQTRFYRVEFPYHQQKRFISFQF